VELLSHLAVKYPLAHTLSLATSLIRRFVVPGAALPATATTTTTSNSAIGNMTGSTSATVAAWSSASSLSAPVSNGIVKRYAPLLLRTLPAIVRLATVFPMLYGDILDLLQRLQPDLAASAFGWSLSCTQRTEMQQQVTQLQRHATHQLLVTLTSGMCHA